jgi:2,4-dienoyl-CoA reductase-like NADH-dependent reductase (Old Yellow Enzyme family)
MSEQFPHLLSPLTMRSVTLPNRIVFTGHGTGYTDRDGLPDDRAVAYYAARARGGAGLQLTGVTSVMEEGSRARDIGAPNGPQVYAVTRRGPVPPFAVGRPERTSGGNRNIDDRIVSRYRAIAEAVHRHGGKFLAQITQSVGMYDWSVDQLSREQIEMIHAALAAGARRAIEAGLDGVELHSGTANLPHHFLSARYNHRTDAYGGDLQGRLRFVKDALRAMRRAIGADAVLGVRMAGAELVEDGYTLQDAVQIARGLAETGDIDYLNIIAGVIDDWISVAKHIAGSYDPHGHLVPYAAAIKRAVAIPVLAVGRIVDPTLAEVILARGEADLVGMTRAQIADPDLGRKVRAGRLEDIRPCVGCVQMCIGESERAHPITCVYNSVAGRENVIGDLTPAASPKRVVVVGGGPAGLETARVAATRGHHVVLFERGGRLGGHVLTAAMIPNREEFAGIARWLEGQVGALAVDVRLNTAATIEAIREENPDVIVVATGSRPQPPAWSNGDIPTFAAQDALAQGLSPRQRVTLVDTDGHFPGVGVADALAAAGHTVRIISLKASIGEELEHANLAGVYRNLLNRNVELVPGTKMVRIAAPNQIVVADVYSGLEREFDDVDALVYTDRAPEDALLRELLNVGVDVRVAGDCLTPRRVDSAVREGFDIGYAL